MCTWFLYVGYIIYARYLSILVSELGTWSDEKTGKLMNMIVVLLFHKKSILKLTLSNASKIVFNSLRDLCLYPAIHNIQLNNITL